jgi:hypothetical protein
MDYEDSSVENNGTSTWDAEKKMGSSHRVETKVARSTPKQPCLRLGLKAQPQSNTHQSTIFDRSLT